MVNRYGTTSDMIIQEVDDNGQLRLLAIDDGGLYFTTPDRVNRGIADVNRYGSSREAVRDRLTELGLDPHTLFHSNKHLIKVEEASVQAKVNPIKASKRR